MIRQLSQPTVADKDIIAYSLTVVGASGINRTLPKGGIKTYATLSEAERVQYITGCTRSIVRCVIPKGTLFVTGHDSNGCDCYRSERVCTHSYRTPKAEISAR